MCEDRKVVEHSSSRIFGLLAAHRFLEFEDQDVVLRVLQLRVPKLRIVWTLITACLTVESRLVRPMDKQVVFGNVCEFYEIRTQGP